MADSIPAAAPTAASPASPSELRKRILDTLGKRDQPVSVNDERGELKLLAIEMGYHAHKAYDAAKKAALVAGKLGEVRIPKESIDFELLLPFAIVDGQGQTVFTLEDVVSLGQLGRSMVGALIDAARDANGIN